MSTIKDNNILVWSSIPKRIVLIAIFFGIFQFSFSFYLKLFTSIEKTESIFIEKIEFSLTDNKRSLHMNPAEESNYSIAKNKVAGKGYTTFDVATNTYKASAFHSSFPVFLYEFLIFHEIDFDLYITFYIFISAILHSMSLLALFQILRSHGKKYAEYGLILWALFPPVIFYINPLFLYESFCTAALIIIYERVNNARATGSYSISSQLMIIILSGVSIFFRLQLIPILFLLFSSAIIFPGKIKRLFFIFSFSINAAIILIICIPVLEKNNNDFGAAVLSTQLGYELWEGSNPIARGSWSGTGESRKLGLNSISNIEDLNQLEISNILKYKAIDWAISHPTDYLYLSLRKMAIYFIPQNYEPMPGSRIFNPINAIIYIGFIIFLIHKIYNKEDLGNTIVLISPIIGSIFLTLIFFVGYRWRYYGEPFMLICTIKIFDIYINKFGKINKAYKNHLII